MDETMIDAPWSKPSFYEHERLRARIDNRHVQLHFARYFLLAHESLTRLATTTFKTTRKAMNVQSSLVIGVTPTTLDPSGWTSRKRLPVR